MPPKKTATPKWFATPALHAPTLRHVHRLLRAEGARLERAAKDAGREGGVLLAHAAGEWARATACADLAAQVERLLDDAESAG
jgi:hypothetical protein